MFLLIDNYDSFTYNLSHYMGEVGAEVHVHRNDAISIDQIIAMAPEGIVISPGPCDPDKAGICLDVIAQLQGKFPIFGVCLGHQCIAQAFGARIERAPKPMHGKMSDITHRSGGMFSGVPSPFKATRYHSLTIAPGSVPDCLDITAESEDGVIQGVSHKTLPIHGVQFHPESIASEHGHKILQNFIELSRGRNAA